METKGWRGGEGREGEGIILQRRSLQCIVVTKLLSRSVSDILAYFPIHEVTS